MYDWGKPGSSSLVARLSKNAIGPDFVTDEEKSYAEVRSSSLGPKMLLTPVLPTGLDGNSP